METLPKHIEIGQKGEQLSVELLEKKGYKILHRNWKMGHLEMDIIAANKTEIVFVEVKTRRTGAPGNGLSAVNQAKQKRILNAALIYLMQNKWTRRTVRFDLVEIHRDGILYVPNAFQPYGHFYH